MKEKIKDSLKKLVSDRYFFVLIIIMIVQMIIFSIVLGLSIRVNDRQLISHYTAFGGTNFYFGQWYYLFVFVVFGVITALLHSIIAIKLLTIKGRSLAFMFVWFGIGMVFLGWVMASEILNLQALL